MRESPIYWRTRWLKYVKKSWESLTIINQPGPVAHLLDLKGFAAHEEAPGPGHGPFSVCLVLVTGKSMGKSMGNLWEIDRKMRNLWENMGIHTSILMDWWIGFEGSIFHQSMDCFFGKLDEFCINGLVYPLVNVYPQRTGKSHLSVNQRTKNGPYILYVTIWLVVGPPLWKIWKSIGMIRNPILMGK